MRLSEKNKIAYQPKDPFSQIVKGPRKISSGIAASITDSYVGGPELPESPQQQRGVAGEVSLGIRSQTLCWEYPGKTVSWNCRSIIDCSGLLDYLLRSLNLFALGDSENIAFGVAAP